LIMKGLYLYFDVTPFLFAHRLCLDYGRGQPECHILLRTTLGL
jgi:hypothetical protein